MGWFLSFLERQFSFVIIYFYYRRKKNWFTFSAWLRNLGLNPLVVWLVNLSCTRNAVAVCFAFYVIYSVSNFWKQKKKENVLPSTNIVIRQLLLL